MLDFKQRRIKRHIRVQAKVRGTAARPRLVVSRSLKYLNCQFIDDSIHKTLLALYERNVDFKKTKATPVERAKILGEKVAASAKEAGITKAVFDRSGVKYHGRIKALAEAARAAGLEF